MIGAPRWRRQTKDQNQTDDSHKRQHHEGNPITFRHIEDVSGQNGSDAAANGTEKKDDTEKLPMGTRAVEFGNGGGYNREKTAMGKPVKLKEPEGKKK